MSEYVPHTPGLVTCLCPQCVLIRCGALDADWDGWSWVEFAGEMIHPLPPAIVVATGNSHAEHDESSAVAAFGAPADCCDAATR